MTSTQDSRDHSDHSAQAGGAGLPIHEHLRGKVVVITGAASGIGRALALQAGASGARLALSDVDAPGLAATVDQLSELVAHKVAVHTEKLDVRDREAWASYATSVIAEYGTVNFLVNNAGVALNGDFTEVTTEQFDFVMDVDYWGVVNGTRAFLPHLIDSGDGYLVNISSLFGLMAVPGQTAYNSAKFAVRGFTEALRMELKIAQAPVTVTCVHPGGIKTAIARNAAAAPGLDAAKAAALFDKKLAKTTAEEAASVIFAATAKRKARVLIGKDAKALDLLVRLTGSGYQRVVSAASAATTKGLRAER